jgi:hypothetical protein
MSGLIIFCAQWYLVQFVWQKAISAVLQHRSALQRRTAQRQWASAGGTWNGTRTKEFATCLFGLIARLVGVG